MKTRIIRNVFLTCDALTRARFFGTRTRDEILNADPVPKLLLMPTTWRGDLRPILDTYLAQLAPLSNGLTLGRTLSAEEVPATLDLGTAWLGDFRDRMLAARDESRGAVEATEVLRKIDEVRTAMGTGDARRISDGLHRLRRAADSVNGALFGSHCDRDDEHLGKRVADATRRRVASINDANSRFWDKRSAAPLLDSRGRMQWRGGDAAPAARPGVRDAAHAAAEAVANADPRARLAALNRGARAFWSGAGEPITADALRRMPVPTTVSEINQRNRAFWAGRS